MLLNFGRNNESLRQEWIRAALAKLPPNSRVLDAGAGELKNKAYCKHVEYISQDFCQYEGKGDGTGLQTGSWNTSHIDIVSDIKNIPAPDSSFDAIICTEVFEHLPNPVLAIKEFSRLIKPNGQLIITAPFCSLTHFAPHFYATGFSRYWYDVNLREAGFSIREAVPSGGWFDYLAQELFRLPRMGRIYSATILGWCAFIISIPLVFLLWLLKISDKGSHDLLCFGWHIVAIKE